MKFPSSRFSTFGLIFFSTLFFVSVSYAFSTLLAALVAVVAVLLVYLVSPLWRRDGDLRSRIRFLALTILAAATAPLLSSDWFPGFANRLIITVNDNYDLNLPVMPTGEISGLQIVIYVVFALCITLIAIKYPRPTIMRKAVEGTPLDQDQDFLESFDKFVSLWGARMDGIDRSLNWTDQDFISLEAEVETGSTRKWGRNVSPLVDALKRIANTQSADRPVVILGEPGSGKSVALRRLARLLLMESSGARRIPIYVNLKSWQSPSYWIHGETPRSVELQEFIKEAILTEANDFFAERFMNKYFEKMFGEGRFFFIFDSFDEIPLVIDNPENSWAIEAVSKCLNNFLQGTHSSQGIVASRYFKKPTNALGAQTIFRIRPFDEDRIRQILRIVGGMDHNAILEAFRTNSSILSSATNPMIANLLASYVRERNGRWPKNTYEMYSDYTIRRLEDPIVQQRLSDADLTIQGVLNISSQIAQYMIESDTQALNVSLEELTTLENKDKIHAVVDILKFTRMGRLTTSDTPNFSFSHRRFHEFFVVTSMSTKQIESALESIQSDNRYRDILALYCETAPTEAVNHVATHAVELLHSENSPDSHRDLEKFRGGVQVLRFISDAFRSRNDLSEQFNIRLAQFVKPILTRSKKGEFHPLLGKFAAESLNVLSENDASDIMNSALKYPSQYVRETAFRASRHVVPAPKTLRDFVNSELLNQRYRPLSGSELLKRFRSLRFSLKLSSGFGREIFSLYGWLLDVFLFPISFVLLFFSTPLGGIVYVLTLSKIVSGNHPREFLWGARFLSFFIPAMILSPILLVVAAYAQFSGMGPEVVFSSDTFRSAVSFPFPPYLLKDAVASVTPVLSALIVLILFLNLFFPILPVGLGTSWDILNRNRREIKKASQIRQSDRPSLNDIVVIIRQFLRDFREGAWKAPEPLTKRQIVLGLFFTVFSVALLGLALSYGIFVALFFALGPVLFLSLLFVFPKLLSLSADLLKAWIKDNRLLAKLELPSFVHRSAIEEILNSLSLERSRLRFLNELSIKHVTVEGSWKNFDRLFFEDDPVTDELIRLEERWLRLDD